MKRLVILFTLAAGMVLLLAACGGGESASPAPSGVPAGPQAIVPDEIGVGTPGRVRLVEFYADW